MITHDDLKALQKAARRAGALFGYDAIQDLAQELALKLLAAAERPKNLDAALSVWARNAVADLSKAKDAERRNLRLVHEVGAVPYRRKGPNWRPTWYPPHEDAVELCPAPCSGARLMHAKSEARVCGGEDVLIAIVDSSRGKKRQPRK